MGQAIRDEKAPETKPTTAELIEQLQGLAHVEIDATYALETAIGKHQNEKLAALMEGLRDDHVAHVLEISSLIYGYGGQAPKPVRDWKGFLLEGATHLRSSLETEYVLKALRLVETLAVRFYDDLLNQDIPKELRTTLSQHRNTNERHLSALESFGRAPLSPSPNALS